MNTGLKNKKELTDSMVIGSVKSFAQIGLQTLARMKSASNRGILKSRLQVHHVHVLLVAPLGTGYMA